MTQIYAGILNRAPDDLERAQALSLLAAGKAGDLAEVVAKRKQP